MFFLSPHPPIRLHLNGVFCFTQSVCHCSHILTLQWEMLWTVGFFYIYISVRKTIWPKKETGCQFSMRQMILQVQSGEPGSEIILYPSVTVCIQTCQDVYFLEATRKGFFP